MDEMEFDDAESARGEPTGATASTRTTSPSSATNAASARVVRTGKPGRPRGYPRSGGRVKGAKNAITQDLRAMIGHVPIKFLLQIVEGRRVRTGPQAGPGETVFAYPDLNTRMKAAGILAGKVLADLQVSEIKSTNDTTVRHGPISDIELAQRIGYLLMSAEPPAPISESADDHDEVGTRTLREAPREGGEPIRPRGFPGP